MEGGSGTPLTFHSFTTEAFANMISELRKYRLGLVLAHQYTAQLNKEVFEAILGNVGTLISFRVGATDASIITKQFGADIPLPRDLVNLANYDMFIKMMIEGKQTGVFSGRAQSDKYRRSGNEGGVVRL